MLKPSNGFQMSLYVERPDLESSIVAECRNWYDRGPRAGWLSLLSAPGRGNTWLLHGLEKKIRDELLFSYMARTVVVTSDQGPEGVAGGISPLQEALTRPLVTRFERAKRFAATAFRPSAILAVITVVVAFLLYHAARDFFIANPHAGIDRFFTEYFIAERLRMYILFLLLGVVGTFTSSFMQRFLRPGEEMLVAVERKNLLNTRGMIEGLRRHARGRSVLFVLIDASHLLRSVDRALLHDFLSRSEDPDIKEFLGRHRVLFITLDRVEELLHKIEPLKRIDVSRFTKDQLLEIARRMRPEIYERDVAGDADAADTIKEAEDSIHALVIDSRRLEAEAQSSFEKLRTRNPNPSGFGAESLMVYEAVRLVSGTGSATPSKEWLRKWLADKNLAKHLSLFGAAPPKQVDSVISELREDSSISRFLDRHIAYDIVGCRAMVEWTRSNVPELPARAYYFQLVEAIGNITAADIDKALRTVPAVHHRAAIKKAAWIARELGEFLESPDVLLSCFRDRKQADEARRLIVSVLVMATVIYLREGESPMAIDAASEALEWIDESFGKSHGDLVDLLSMVLWEMFWLTADTSVSAVLEELKKRVPDVVDGTVWAIEKRYLNFVSLVESEPWTRGSNALRPLLADRLHLAEAYQATRAQCGVLFWMQQHPEIPPAIGGEFPASSATALRSLRFTALISDLPAAAAYIDACASIQRTSHAASCVGDEVLMAFDRAAIEHARFRLKAQESTDEEELRALADESAASYKRCVLLASIVGWRGLTSEVSFHYGRALSRVLILGDAERDQEAWEIWKAVFQSTVDVEASAQWMLFTPDVEEIRWWVFRQLDVESSLESGYTAYSVGKAAGFPKHVLVELSTKLRPDFTNHATPPPSPDRQREAELREEWADLAEIPEARPHWTQSTLELEQAINLSFAAQAYRMADDLAKAEATLDRAQSCYDAQPATEDPKILDEAHEVLLNIRFQRMSVYRQMENEERANALAREIWSSLRGHEEIFGSIIRVILSVERRNELLDAPWPGDGKDLQSDPDAAQLSVDGKTIADAGLMTPNHYEYRLLQLEQHIARAGYAGDARRAVIRFGTSGLEYSDLGRGTLAGRLIEMLKQTRAEAAKLHEKAQEIEALRLLFTATDDPAYREDYIAETTEYEQLLADEAELATHTTVGWFELAERMHHFLHILVDERLSDQREAEAHFRAGVTPEAFHARRELRTRAYAAAQAAFDRKAFEECMTHLEAGLPSMKVPWVFWDDLRALNQWIACSQAVDAPAEQRALRAQQIRVFTTRYGQQLALSIDDEAGHRLGLKLQHLVEQALRQSAQVPIATTEEEEPEGGGGGIPFDPSILDAALLRVR